MKIINLKLEGVGGIKSIELVFHEKMNLLCVSNGIGKTTILESIAHIFSNGQTNILKRNVNSPSSIIKAEVESDNKVEFKEVNFDTFVPEKQTFITGFYQLASGLILLKTTRTFQYISLEAVNKSLLRNQFLYNLLISR